MTLIIQKAGVEVTETEIQTELQKFDTQAYRQQLQAAEADKFASMTAFPTHYMMAQLASAVYEPQGFSETRPLPTDWRCIAVAENPKDDYFGAAYVSPDSQKVVIAHRGTCSAQDWFGPNFEGIINQRVTSQMASANQFVEMVTRHLSPGQAFFLSGHSLGGWLAMVTAYHCEARGLHAHVRVFDSPGGRDILEDIQPKLGQAVSLENLDIINVVSASEIPSFYNKQISCTPLNLLYYFSFSMLSAVES